MSTKLTLLAASTALSLVASTSAFALTPNVYPAANLQANGASSVANIAVQELNCFAGTNNPLGVTTPATTPIPDFNYVPATVTASNPLYDCATQSIQPALDGKYISTGSGGGKTSWKNHNASGISNNPFGTWTTISFALSDSAITGPSTTSGTELATYEANAKPVAGPAIQIPMYILPIAVGYSPLYGKRKTGSGIAVLTFSVKYPHVDGSAGGLRMKKSTYCGIFNGTITNWNDAALKADNGGQSLMSPLDDATRWTTTGVPIKLVGRSDNSGTTNLFTRHLTAVCGGTVYTAGGTDQLPAAVKNTGATYDKTTGVLTGTEVTGQFGLTNGSDGIAHAVDISLADPANVGDYTLNGRLGYVGADWVSPSTLSASSLASADLQSGTTTKFLAPSATNSTAAFKGILPPQSATNGKYAPATLTAGLRDDPQAWVVPANATTGLANPVAGYPIVGTTNMLLYTCYADAAVRNAVQGFILGHFGKIATDSTGAKIPPKYAINTAKGADATPLGILPKNGVAPLPAAFTTAIGETFLTKVTTGSNPSALKLYIQNIQPKKTADIAAATGGAECATAQGGDGTYTGA